MARIVELTGLDDPAVAVYATLTEAQLRNALNPERGVIIVESPKVIDVALKAGYEPLSMLCEQRHIEGDAAGLLSQCPGDMPLYTGERQLLRQLTGYTLTRGVLCAMRRPADCAAAEVCAGASRVAVIDAVCDTTNIGAIFRSAAALGIDAVVLTRQSCDPLNRRSIRVSMGSVFLVPWGWLDGPVSSLHQLGFSTVAMALTDKSVNIDDPALAAEDKLAIIVGTEGDGLGQDVIDQATWTARIPMSHGVDSLNVGAAAAIAFWQLRKNGYE